MGAGRHPIFEVRAGAIEAGWAGSGARACRVPGILTTQTTSVIVVQALSDSIHPQAGDAGNRRLPQYPANFLKK